MAINNKYENSGLKHVNNVPKKISLEVLCQKHFSMEIFMPGKCFHFILFINH